MQRGVYGTLESCDPPITIPAWSAMLSGKSPGELGVYGFRNRKSWAYDSHKIATSLAIKSPRIWDVLSEHNLSSSVIGVPQTFPIKPLNGTMVSGLLTPDIDSPCTYPEDLKDDLIKNVGDIRFDATPFRTNELDNVLKRIYALMQNRFAVARYMLENDPCDFFMMVEMGLDRLHHAFWKFCDPNHPQFVQGNSYENVFKKYYEAMDEEIGTLLQMLDDDTNILVVSDHGAQPLHGGIRINQWLINEGYLTLNQAPPANRPISADIIDWTRTIAWGDGGYYARICLNLDGREPNGIVPQNDYKTFRDEIKRKLSKVILPDGAEIENTILYPDQTYPKTNGHPPDLIVYFDNLKYRSIGTLQGEEVYSVNNDQGPDGANHARHGIWMGKGEGLPTDGSFVPASLYDVFPTLLNWFNIHAQTELTGHSLLNRDTLN